MIGRPGILTLALRQSRASNWRQRADRSVSDRRPSFLRNGLTFLTQSGRGDGSTGFGGSFLSPMWLHRP
jgi:hypothetical protein